METVRQKMGNQIERQEERASGDAQKPVQGDKPRLTRRGFIKGAGAIVVTAGAAAVAAGCDTAIPGSQAPGQALVSGDPDIIRTQPTAVGGPSTRYYHCLPDQAGGRPLEFFRPHEARTVEAIAARIIPGDADDPGAREAGVVNYIDCLLATGLGYAEPIYREPPFAMGYDEDDPPSEQELQTEGVIWLPNDLLERYGYQSVLTPREIYRMGLQALDRYANRQYGGDFVDLSEGDQDAVLEAVANDEAEGFDDPSATSFFEALRDHTVEGMFSDPIYGGNQDMAGWRLVGFPGAQRGYTVRDLKTEGYRRNPQGLPDLHHYHPGQTNESNVILPVQGSEQ
jgi:gluconate 2-dehydrogenase gamma chain